MAMQGSVIDQGFADPDLLRDNCISYPSVAEDKWVFTYELQAIGDAMISEENGDTKILDYRTFRNRFSARDSEEFSSCFETLSKLFWNLKSNEAKFRRIVAAYTILSHFINYVDPKHLRTQLEAYHWNHLSEAEAERVKRLLREVKHRDRKVVARVSGFFFRY
jgi:hypothetical protein